MFFRKKIKPQFTITIPEPCSEDWEKMRVVDDEHRHCDSCEKTLTDFTKMSDDELMLFFKYNNKKLCGRFLKEQVDRPLPMINEEPHRLSQWKAVILLPLAFLSRSVSAQQNDSIPAIDSTQIVQNDTISPDTSGTEEIAVDSLPSEPDTTVVEKKRKPRTEVITVSVVLGGMMNPSYDPRYICGGMGAPYFPEMSPRTYPFWDVINWLLHPIRKSNSKPPELVATNNNNVTPIDPSEKKEEPEQPMKPAAPWYEAILPESLRIRRKA